MTASKYIWLTVSAIVVNTLPRIIDFGTMELMDGGKYSPIGKKVYYGGQALSFILLLLSQKHYDKSNKQHNIIFEITGWIALSNLLDELFFNPVRLGVNEIIFAVIVAVWTTHKLRK